MDRSPLDKSSNHYNNILDGELTKTPTKLKIPLNDKSYLDN